MLCSLAFVADTLIVGCITPSYIPPSLWSEVDQDLTFTQIQQSPDRYVGHLVLLGGEITSTTQLHGDTWIQVLQLPLYGLEAPWWDRTTSEGSFLATRKGSPDVQDIMPGTLVSIVGQVTGSRTAPNEQSNSAYPSLEITLLKVWPWKLTSDDWFYHYWYYYTGRFAFQSGSGSGF
jgi:starvation-inducible outer membrane lipoprotein